MLVKIVSVIAVFIFLVVILWTNAEPATTTEAFLPPHPKPPKEFPAPAPLGTETKLNNLTIYESPYNRSSSKHMLIAIYDIFGFHPHVKYISDELAKSGFLVIIPDLFYGNPIPLKNFPQPNVTERLNYIFKQNGTWKESRADLLDTVQHYKQKYGITGVGMFGFCWGGKMSVYAASDADFKDLKAIGLVHPSRITNEDASTINIPVLLLPSRKEPDMLPFLDELNRNEKTKMLSEHYRYDNMSHGFAGASSDFTNPSTLLAVKDVINRLSNFFKKTL